MIDVSKIVSGAFSTVRASVGGAVKPVTYRAAPTTQVYDPATGTLGGTETVYTDVTAIFSTFSRKEKETDFHNSRRQIIESGDVKCFIPYASLPITVKLEDVIEESSTRWRIVEHTTDPTGAALHTFHLRRA